MKKMTNEKAKECIDAIIGTWEICQSQKYPSAVDVEIDAEDIVALKMAITALYQEQQSEWECDHEVLKAYADGQESIKSCTDAISRHAVLDINENHHGQMPNHINHQIWQEIKDLPSVSTEKTGRWIPVSESLPENSGRYLAYIVNKHDDKLQYIMTCDYSVDGYWNWFPDDECASDNVIAWMPLPEPYKAESEG